MKRNLDDLSDVYPKPDMKITSVFLDLVNCFVEYFCMKYQDPEVFSYMKSGYMGFSRYVNQLESCGVKDPNSFLTGLVSEMDMFCHQRRNSEPKHHHPNFSSIQSRELYFVIAKRLLKNDDIDLQVFFAELMAKREKLCSLLGTQDPTSRDMGTEFKRKMAPFYAEQRLELHDEPFLLKLDLDRFPFPEDFISERPIKAMIKKIDHELEDKMGISYLVQEKKPFRPIPLGLALQDWDYADGFVRELLENHCPLDKLIHHAKKVFGDKWQGELQRLVKQSKNALNEQDWSDLNLLSQAPAHFEIRYSRKKPNWNSAQEVDEEIYVTSNGLCSFELRSGRSKEFQLEPSQIHLITIHIARLRPEDINTGLQGNPTKDFENEDIHLIWGNKDYSWQNESDWGDDQHKFRAIIELLNRICS